MYEIPHMTAAKKKPIPTTTPYPTPTGTHCWRSLKLRNATKGNT